MAGDQRQVTEPLVFRDHTTRMVPRPAVVAGEFSHAWPTLAEWMAERDRKAARQRRDEAAHSIERCRTLAGYMLEGFRVGKANRRSVTTRMPGDGGNLEREEATKYRGWAKAIAFEHSHTAKALNELADEYEWRAKKHDEDAERRDWSY
jgi:hypothetical protein